jgi:hypothetical protein
MMDLGKKKAGIFCGGKKLRPYQGIKNNKSHANLLQSPYYPTPFQNIVHLD